MGYKIKTNRGIIFTVNGENFSPEAYMGDLNNEKLLMVPLGVMLAQKHNIEWIAPDEAQINSGQAFKIEMSSGDVLWTDIPDYNTVDFANQFNGADKSFIMLGTVVVNRRNVNMIVPRESLPESEQAIAE